VLNVVELKAGLKRNWLVLDTIMQRAIELVAIMQDWQQSLLRDFGARETDHVYKHMKFALREEGDIVERIFIHNTITSYEASNRLYDAIDQLGQ